MNRRHEVCSHGTLEHEPGDAGAANLSHNRRVIVNAEHNDRHIGTTPTQSRCDIRLPRIGERQIHDNQARREFGQGFHHRSLIRHHQHALEQGL